MMIAAGIGCRSGCGGAEIAALVAAVLREADRPAAGVVLCAPDRKRGEPGLTDAAARLGLPLTFVTAAALAAAEPLTVTRSARALAATGIASVAEAAALAGAGGLSGATARLLVPRRSSRHATCALAASEISP